MKPEIVLGTRRQDAYIRSLVRERAGGEEDAVAVCSTFLKRSIQDLVDQPPSSKEAGSIIARLTMAAEKTDEPRRAVSKSAAKPGSTAEPCPYTTAKQLRQYATGQHPVDVELDEHATWVLTRLKEHAKVLEALFDSEAVQPPPAVGINGNGPIRVQDLLTHFGSWDGLAEAFKVTVPTAKAWGTNLPESRNYEAEVKTRGYVRANWKRADK